MIIMEGVATPNVVKTPPRTPALKPTKVAVLIAIGPGVDSAIAMISNNSSLIHFFFNGDRMDQRKHGNRHPK